MDEPRRLQLPSWLVMTTAPHPSPNSMHVPAYSPKKHSGEFLVCKMFACHFRYGTWLRQPWITTFQQ